MTFFLIVPSVMIIGVLLIHALANRLGLRIYYTTLIAAAILSIAVDFAATLTGAVGRGYLLRLGLMILVVAALLTAANRFLLKRQQAEEKKFDEEVKAAYEASKNENLPDEEEPAPLDKFKRVEEETLFEAPPAYNATIDADKKSVDADKKSSVDADKKSSDKAGEELNTDATLPENFLLEKVFKPLPEVKPEEADKPIKLEEKPKDEFPLEKVFEPLSDAKTPQVKHFDAPKKNERTELFPLQEVFKPLSTLDLNKIEEITEEEKALPHEIETKPEEKIATLDDLLDKAYEERDKGHIWQAIETYKKALERYRNDEYAPFVAIDLGNIYKEQAMYSKAIKIYEEALALPAIRRNPSTGKEFLSTLEYLRVVHRVLTEHKALSTPFSQLSKEILQEIDTEFKKIQISSAQ